MDKVEQFTETVYTCVLLVTCKQTLTLFPPANLSGAFRFALMEAPGRVFSFSDKARYEWEHGVPVITDGERVSVSWRFFKQDHPKDVSKPRPAKIPRIGFGNTGRPNPRASPEFLRWHWSGPLGGKPHLAGQSDDFRLGTPTRRTWQSTISPTTIITAIYVASRTS